MTAELAASFEPYAMEGGEMPRALRALRDVGYDGWVTIELYPFQKDAPAVARRAFEFVRSIQ